jgi:hypothetical protein
MIERPPATDQKPVTKKKTFRIVDRSIPVLSMRLNKGKADRNGQVARNGIVTIEATR